RAIAEFNAAIALDPSIKHAHCGLATAYIDCAELGSALEAFETELSKDPNCFDSFLYLAEIYAALGRRSEAAHAFRESVRTTSHHVYEGGPGVSLSEEMVKWIRDLARSGGAAGRPSTEALRRGAIEALFAKANKLANSGESLKAADIYTEVLRRQPDSPRAYAFRGGCFASINEHEKALADLHKATELDPSNADAWFNIYCVFHNRLLFEDAREALEKARLLDPEMVKRRQRRESNRPGLVRQNPFDLNEALEDAFRQSGICCAHCGCSLRRPLGTQFLVEDQDVERVMEGIPYYCPLCKVNACYKCQDGGTSEEPRCRNCSTRMTKWGEADAQYSKDSTSRDKQPESGYCTICRRNGPLRN
ncbi:MAG: tetratricopeptide repeat protein, partial [Blastocatellia bacterium]